jgi:16S rRNA (guanine527-N7)-methyltransferase
MKENEALRSGINDLGLVLSDEMQTKLLAYLDLMLKWNKIYNLTAIRNKGEMVSNHLLDSLAVLPYLWKGRWLDVGCGGGLPGLVLAIAKPEWTFTLLDSNTKKTSFVQQAVIDLEIKNVSVYSGRVESWNDGADFDGIISRAFSELGDFMNVTSHLLASNGRWAAMKGQLDGEIESIPAGCEIERIIQLKVPSLTAARSLVIAKVSGGCSK